MNKKIKGIRGFTTAIKVISIIAVVVLSIGACASVLASVFGFIIPDDFITWDVTADVGIHIDYKAIGIPDDVASEFEEVLGTISGISASGGIGMFKWLFVTAAISSVGFIILFAFVIRSCNGILENKDGVYSVKTKNALIGIGVVLIVNKVLAAVCTAFISLVELKTFSFSFGINLSDIVVACIYILALLIYCYIGELEAGECDCCEKSEECKSVPASAENTDEHKTEEAPAENTEEPKTEEAPAETAETTDGETEE